MSDIHILLFDPASGISEDGGRELLADWQRKPGTWAWANISGEPDSAERELLTEYFKIPQLAINDIQRDRHPPKLEVFPEMILLMLRDLVTAYEDSEPEIAQLALMLGPDFLITRHHQPVPSVQHVASLAREQPAKLKDGPGHLAYLIARRLVDNYTPEVLELERHLADLEDQVFEHPNDDVVEMLSRYNRALKRLRRHLVYQCNAIGQLNKPTFELPVAINRHEFNDLFENLERLASLCQLNQELAVDLLNTHLSLLSHRLNQVMRVLTIATVTFLPLGLLAGIYGMNFEFMPELRWHYGYFTVLGTMAVVVIVLVAVFRKRGWL